VIWVRLFVICLSFVGLLFGLDIGTTAITSMNTFRKDMGIPELVPNQPDDPATVDQLSMFAVLFHVFSLVGAPFAGQLSDKFGRKPIIIWASILFTAGAIWQTFAGMISPSFGWTSIILGRCLGGVGNGFILTIMPVYAAELSPSKYRGYAITLFQFFITVGIFLMAVINKGLVNISWGWRLGFAVQCFPCVVIIGLTICVLPESPKYLIKRGNIEDARRALMLLGRGTAELEKVVDFEIRSAEEELAKLEQAGQGSFKDLFHGTVFPAFLCGFMVAFSQNVTGVNWFMNYATQLFSSLGFEPFIMDLALKGTNMGATLAALFFVERFGRKFLTVWGTIFTIIVFLLISVVIFSTGVDITVSNPNSRESAVQLFSMIMIFVFQVVFAITWGPLGWLVPAEVFPVRVRGIGMSCAVVGNMLTNIICGDYGYNALNSSTNTQTTMLVLVILNVVIVLSTVVFLQPETKGVTLEDMRKVFAYEKGGNAYENHGTLHQFFRRNARQTLDIIRCRGANPYIGITEEKVESA